MEVFPVFLIFLILPASFGKPNSDQSNQSTQESAPSDNPNHEEWDHKDPRWNTKIPGRESFVTPKGPAAERSRKFWVNQGQNVLMQKINQHLNYKAKKAKNLVIFIGDGMGISTQMAARVYKGDVNSELAFEKFPFAGLAKTYCVNYQVPDSACTATAFLTGVKNNYEVLGMTAEVDVRDCQKQQDNSTHLDSIFKFAQDAGRATGVVTNTRLSHATPAAVYAHSASRFWESNENTPKGCDDIAHQMIYGRVGSKLDVIMGGGLCHFLPVESSGWRTDGRNLINEYHELQRQQNNRFVYVTDRQQLMSVDLPQTDKILGIFSSSHLEYKLLANAETQPSLIEMTAKALEVLKKNEDGFVLLVEGGRIDHAHHATQARLSLEETLEFEKTVEFVRKETAEEDTLIVVGADHGHVFTVGGYQPRGRNILGVGDFSHYDGNWFFTLSYANGPGSIDHSNPDGSRKNPQGMSYMDPSFRQPTMLPLNSETHPGEDVGVYALGPYSHIFSGVYEQSYIAHAMMYATCLGPDDFAKNPDCTGEASVKKFSLSLLMTLSIFYLFRWKIFCS